MTSSIRPANGPPLFYQCSLRLQRNAGEAIFYPGIMALPRLVLTAESPSFDEVTISDWQDEGYVISYLPYRSNKKEYLDQLEQVALSLELEEFYAVVGVLPFRFDTTYIACQKLFNNRTQHMEMQQHLS